MRRCKKQNKDMNDDDVCSDWKYYNEKFPDLWKHSMYEEQFGLGKRCKTCIHSEVKHDEKS